jgi:hypothetical protein
MTRASITTGALLVAFSWVGRAAAQSPSSAPDHAPTPPETTGAPAAPPAPPPAAAPAPPVPVPAPPPPAPAPPAVQTFEPTDVTGPKGVEPVPVSTTPTKTPPNALPLTMDEMPVAAANNRVTINLFGDTALAINSVGPPGLDGFLPVTPHRPAFLIGDLDLLITGRAGNLTAMAETALEQHGGGEIGIDLERIFVGWRGDRISVDAGRTHAELGYWNNAFHHGRWLQIPTGRPEVLKFEDEGGILPVHQVGVTAHWRAYVDGDQQIELVGSVGNGRGNFTDDVQETDDTNVFKSLLFKLGFKGFGARDLQFGVSGLFDRIAPVAAMSIDPTAFVRPALPDQTINEAIGNAYLAYRGVDLTLISEAFEVLHTSNVANAAGNTSWSTFDAYALGAYRIGEVSPYLMSEVRHTSTDPDPFFFPDPAAMTTVFLRNFYEETVGLRWDFTTWSAIKVEYRLVLLRDPNSRMQIGTIDWCFGL